MKMPLGIESLRSSTLRMWQHCPLQVWMLYRHGPARPTGSAFSGTCGHRAIEANFFQKIETRRDIPLHVFLGVFENEFDFGKHEINWMGQKPSDYKKKFLDRGGILTYFHKHHIEEYQPELIEHQFLFEIEGGVEVSGTIDFYGRLMNGTPVVIDWKFSKSRKYEARGSNQLTTYALALEAEGKPVKSVAEGRLIWGTKEPQFYPDTAKRSGADYLRVREEYRRMAKQLVNCGDDPQLYPQAPTSSFLCSKEWCGWWSKCPRGGDETFGLGNGGLLGDQVVQGRGQA